MGSEAVRRLRLKGYVINNFNDLNRLLDNKASPGYDIVDGLAQQGGTALAEWARQMEDSAKLDDVVLTGGVSHSTFGRRLLDYTVWELQKAKSEVHVVYTTDSNTSYGGASGAAYFAQKFAPHKARIVYNSVPSYSILGAKEKAVPIKREQAINAGSDSISIHLGESLTPNEPDKSVPLVA